VLKIELYLNDIANPLEDHVHFAAFADDIKIWHEVQSESDQLQLQFHVIS